LLLTVEGATVALILVAAVIVLVKLVLGDGPAGTGVTLKVFSVASGTGTSTLFLGVVFGFLSFAGFEAAASLGEETHNPRRDIPRAVMGTALFGGAFFVFVTAVEMMGYGTNKAGLAKFVGSGSLMGDLASSYVGSSLGDVITLGAALSGFACSIACIVAASRLVFALGRDGFVAGRLGEASQKTATPVLAAQVITGTALLSLVVTRLFTNKPFDAFAWTGTIGTLALLVVYGLVTIGAARFLFFAGERRAPLRELPIPALALLVIGYTLYRNVIPYPTGAAAWLPVLAGAWIVLGLAAIVLRPAVARRVGERLTLEEGLRPIVSDEPIALAHGFELDSATVKP
jgi:amino acid transporter